VILNQHKTQAKFAGRGALMPRVDGDFECEAFAPIDRGSHWAPTENLY
jgi:hypothetical protein